MKKRIVTALLCVTQLMVSTLHAQIINPVKVGKDVATDHANRDVYNGADRGMQAVENGVANGVKKVFSKKEKKSGSTASDASSNQANSSSANSSAQTASGGASAGSFKAYANYDFVPGEEVLFEDHFTDDMDGEFPAHWNLKEGQAVVNKQGDDRLVAITKYYTAIQPRMKNASYLPDEFTIEIDLYLDAAYDSNDGVSIWLNVGGETKGRITTNRDYTYCEFPGGKLNGEYPAAIKGEAFLNKWHHFAIAYKNNQLKVYCDQYRILTVPDCGFKPNALTVAGNASDGMPMLFKNFRLAKGGSMNLIGKKFTDSKIIVHGIYFDVNKATIKPESMGSLNQIVKVMQENPDLKFEVGGHTDSDGDDAANMQLSQKRAEAVKAQLVQLGIAAARLSTKGYGESQPMADNASLEGKAMNRRVEFVKK